MDRVQPFDCLIKSGSGFVDHDDRNPIPFVCCLISALEDAGNVVNTVNNMDREKNLEYCLPADVIGVDDSKQLRCEKGIPPTRLRDS